MITKPFTPLSSEVRPIDILIWMKVAGGIIEVRKEGCINRWGIAHGEGLFSCWPHRTDFAKTMHRFLKSSHALLGSRLATTTELLTSEAYRELATTAEQHTVLLAEAARKAGHTPTAVP